MIKTIIFSILTFWRQYLVILKSLIVGFSSIHCKTFQRIFFQSNFFIYLQTVKLQKWLYEGQIDIQISSYLNNM